MTVTCVARLYGGNRIYRFMSHTSTTYVVRFASGGFTRADSFQDAYRLAGVIDACDSDEPDSD